MVWRALCVGCGVVNPYCADTLVKRLSINLRRRNQNPLYNRFRGLRRIENQSELRSGIGPGPPSAAAPYVPLRMYLTHVSFELVLLLAYGMLPAPVVAIGRFWKLFHI